MRPLTMELALFFRKLVTFDRSQLVAHYQRLAPEDRYCRFFGPVSDSFLETYAHRLGDLRRRYVGAFQEGVLLAVGELALDASYPYVLRGEIAVSVEAGLRRQGVGSELMDRLVTIARNRGVRDIAVPCLPENGAMRRLIAKFEGRGVIAGGVYDAHIATRWADAGSGWREALNDWSAAQEALLETFRLSAA